MRNKSNTAIEVVEKNSAKKRIVDLGTKQMLKNQIHRTSYRTLFYSSFRFISWKMWLIQLLLIGGNLLFTCSNNLLHLETTIQSFTLLILFSVIFFMDELFKSFTSNMWELEQTLKYDLKQHITIKLLIFGLFDFSLILVLSIIGKQSFSISLFHFALFLLVPFNIGCLILFSIFTLFRNRLSNILLWSCSGVLCASLIVVTKIYNVYTLPASYWFITYLVTGISLVALAKEMLKNQHSREGAL